MYIVLLLFFANNLVSGDDFSKETKYIDLLPEKEKEEFLERIARRIFHQVQSKDDRDKLSGEVSDTQLDEHDEMIKKILEEESLNLRKNNNDKVKDNNDNNDHANDESLNKNENIQDTLDDQVDLTLRAGKRDKRNDDENANKVPKIIYLKAVSNGDQENEDLNRNEGESDAEDIQIKYLRRNKAENDNELSKQVTQMVDFDTDEAKVTFQDFITDNIESKNPTQSREIDGDKVKNHEHVGDNTIENTPIDPIHSGEIKADENTAVDENNNGDNMFGSTQKIFDSFEKDSKENDEVTESIESTTTTEPSSPDVKPTEETTEILLKIDDTKNESSKNVTNLQLLRSYTKDLTLNDRKEPDESLDVANNESLTGDIVQNEKANEPDNTTNKRNIDESIELESTTPKIEVLTTDALRTEVKLKENNEDIIGDKLNTVIPLKNIVEENDPGKSKTNNNDPQIREITDNKLYTVNQSLLEKDKLVRDAKNARTNNSDEVLKENNKTQDGSDKNIYGLANDIIRVLRKRVGEPNYNENVLQAMYNKINPKEYKVYEVPAGEEPFIPKNPPGKDNKENPYYVPVYNYSPNNAYYDPHNRLGPNADDEKYNNENNDNNDRDDNIDLGRSERDDTNVDDKEVTANGNIDEKSKDSNEYSNFETLLRSFNEHENQRKFRFGTTKYKVTKKIPYKPKLPVVVQYPKITDVILNPNDYFDIDYIYGRNSDIPYKRSCCDTKKEKAKPIFPDSDDSDHPYNSMNLKNHISAVRQLLLKQQHYGFLADTKNHTEFTDEPVQEQDKTSLRSSKTPIETEKLLKTFEKKIKYYIDKAEKAIKDFNNALKKIKINPTKISDYVKSYFPQPKSLKVKHNKLFRKKKKPSIKEHASHLERSNTKQINLKPVQSLRDLKFNFTEWNGDSELNFAKSGPEVDSEPFLTVLEDMVQDSARGLNQYDWLGTTVDIQAALMKLLDLTDALQNGAKLSKPDLNLFKYILFLHKFSNSVQKSNSRKFLIPRNKRKGSNRGITIKKWILKMLVDITMNKKIVTDDLKDLSEFLNDLQYYLYDLHTAITNIATVTKYKSQRWVENLKELYLDTTKKHLLEVLLHLSTSRLLDLVENSAKNGLEDDFLMYALKNEKTMQRTKEEMIFVLKIIKELKKLP